MSKAKFLLILVCLSLIIFLDLKYRFRSYDTIPPVSESFDEQVLVWVGSSLINNQIPVGWSFIEDYVRPDSGQALDGWTISVDGQKPTLSNFSTFPKPLSKKEEITLDGYTSHFTMVQPHIEQPPLGPILSSLLSGSYKKSTFEEVTLKEMRVPVILLSAVSIILIFFIALLSFGLGVALLSSLLYALIPTVVITSRLVTAENYLTPFLLLGVLLTQFWIKKGKKVYLLLASILIPICYLIKPFGIALAGVIFLSILVFERPKKYLVFPIISSILGMGLFFAYGNFYDQDLFQKIVSYQTNRWFSPLHGIYKIVLPKITKLFLDGWVVFGWLSIAALTVGNVKRNFWVLAPVLCYLVMFLLYGGLDYGWYRLPIYPFLAIAIARLLYEGVKGANVWIGTAFLVTVFATSLNFAYFGLNWNSVVMPSRLIILGIFLLLTLGFLPKFKALSSVVFVILIAVTLWLSIQTINNMPIIWPLLGDKI